MGDVAVAALLRVVADEVDEVIGDAGGAAGAGGDFLGAGKVDGDF